MTSKATLEQVSIWLIPCDKHKSLLSKHIIELSKKLNSPIFEPHLTLFSGKTSLISARQSIDYVAKHFKQLSLETLAVETESIFTKTLYLSIRGSKELLLLSDSFSKYFHSSSFSLDPHLSLAYKNLPKIEREHLMHETSPKISEIKFSSVRAMRTPMPVKSEDAIKTWTVLFVKDLG